MSVFTGLNTKCLRKGDPQPPDPAPGVVRLYSMRFCPYAEKVLLTLAAKGIEAEVVNIHLRDKPDWIFKINPSGQVPALVIDGEVVVESGLIPEFIDEKFSNGKRLLPADPYLRYRQKLLVQQLAPVSIFLFLKTADKLSTHEHLLLRACHQVLVPDNDKLHVGPAFFGLSASRENPELADEKYAEVEKIFSKAEELLQGNEVGYADLLTFPFFERHYHAAHLGIGLLDGANFPGETKFPRLTKWFAAMMSQAFVQEVIQSDEAFKAFFLSYGPGTTDFDAGL